MQENQRVCSLLDAIEATTARVGVVGLGYVGLPFAVEKGKVGFKVLGFDRNALRVEKVNQGQNFIGDVKDEDLASLVGQGLLSATTDMSRLAEMDVIVIAVPTPLTKNLNPDLQYIEAVTRDIAHYLRPGQLISLESTTYPGTTDEIMKPILEGSGLLVGRDVFLAHSPERVDPGNARYTTKNTNKVVGASDPASREVAVAFYRKTIQHVVVVSSAAAAELTKVFENTFRAVNIALVNELTMLCDRMGLSVWEVLDAAFSKPFGIMPFYPGPGVGGHCIPLDPHYLEWKAREYNFNTRFIALAGEINRHMPEFVVEKAMRLLSHRGKGMKGSRVLALGVAYKRDIDDPRESPAGEVIRLFAKHQAEVVYHDPHVAHFTELGLDLHSQPLTGEEIRRADLVVVLTDHVAVDYALVAREATEILDTRNVFKRVDAPKSNIVML
ncbi:MAG: nucleotide sugar dehydrogenase [Holophagaceae bacterium]|nr:nucleotide sugar dehydrogenase [Holophagaceae bacterium]